MQTQSKAKWTKTIVLSTKTFYLDMWDGQYGPSLTITGSRKNKETGGYDKQRIFVNQSDLPEFIAALQEATIA